MSTSTAPVRMKKPSTIQEHMMVLKAWRADIDARKNQHSQVEPMFESFRTWEKRKFDTLHQMVSVLPTQPAEGISIDGPAKEFITMRRNKRQRRSSILAKNPQLQELLDQYVELGPPQIQLPTFTSLKDAYEYYNTKQATMEEYIDNVESIKHNNLNTNGINNHNNNTNNNNNPGDISLFNQTAFANEEGLVNSISFDHNDNDLLPSNTLSFELNPTLTNQKNIPTPRTKQQQQQQQPHQSSLKASNTAGGLTITTKNATYTTNIVQTPLGQSTNNGFGTPGKKKLAQVVEDDITSPILPLSSTLQGNNNNNNKKMQSTLTQKTPNQSLLTPSKGIGGTGLVKKGATHINTPIGKGTIRVGGVALPGSTVKPSLAISKAGLATTGGGVGMSKGGIIPGPTPKRPQQTVSSMTTINKPVVVSLNKQQQQTVAKVMTGDESDSDEFDDAQEYSGNTYVQPNSSPDRELDISTELLHLDTPDLAQFHQDMLQKIDQAVVKEQKQQQQQSVQKTKSSQQQEAKKRKFSQRSIGDTDDDDDNENSNYDSEVSDFEDESDMYSNNGSSGSEYTPSNRSSVLSMDDSDSYGDDDDYTPTKKLNGKNNKAVKTASSSTKKLPSSTTKKPADKIKQFKRSTVGTKKTPVKNLHDNSQYNDSTDDDNDDDCDGDKYDDEYYDDDDVSDDNHNKDSRQSQSQSTDNDLDSLPFPTNHLNEDVDDILNQSTKSFAQILDEKYSPPLNISNLKLGSSHLQNATINGQHHPSLASPSRTASAARAFVKQGITAVNQASHKSPLNNKLSGFTNTVKTPIMQNPQKAQQLLQQQQAEKQRLLAERQKIETELREMKKLENVMRYAENQSQASSKSNGGITPAVPLTPILTDKLSKAKEVSKNVMAQTPRFPRDPISITMEPPGSDTEHDDLIPDHMIPSWADKKNIPAIQSKQSLVDADAIFIQPRANWCKMEEMFQYSFQRVGQLLPNGRPRRGMRNRGSSAYWGNDKLHDNEIKACNKALGIYTDNF